MTFGSLFAGIGGLDLGLERAGMVCKWQVEIDGYARRVLAKHWPNVRRWDDIKTFPPDAEQLALRNTPTKNLQPKSKKPKRPQSWGSSAQWRVDLICGGFPCQDISYAGKGAGLDGERSGLFYEAVRVAGLLKPRYLLLENVAALLNRGMVDVLGTLASIGFNAEWHCLQAADFGAPHIRDRVFIIAKNVADPEIVGRGNVFPTNQRPPNRKSNAPRNGSEVLAHSNTDRGGEQDRNPTDEKRIPGETRRESLQGKQRRKQDFAGADVEPASAIPDPPRIEREPGTGRGRIRQSDTAEFAQFWATEPDVGRVADGIPARVDRLRGIGNAVVPQIAEWLGRQIIEADSKTPADS